MYSPQTIPRSFTFSITSWMLGPVLLSVHQESVCQDCQMLRLFIHCQLTSYLTLAAGFLHRYTSWVNTCTQCTYMCTFQATDRRPNSFHAFYTLSMRAGFLLSHKILFWCEGQHAGHQLSIKQNVVGGDCSIFPSWMSDKTTTYLGGAHQLLTLLHHEVGAVNSCGTLRYGADRFVVTQS